MAAQWARTGTIFRVAATFMGTVVGAGFASGQETLRFFTAHGHRGLLGLALSTVLLVVYGMLIMDLGHRLRTPSHRPILHFVCGPRVGGWADTAVTAFLLAILSVMLAGAGAVAAEQLHLPPWAGVLGTAALTLLTILGGLGGLMTANGVVVPALVLVVSGLCLISLSVHGLPPLEPHPALAAAPNWFASGWLYAGYNLVLAIPVLAPLGAQVADRRSLALGGLAGGLGLGLLGAALHLTLAAHLPAAGQMEVPMLAVARLYPLPVQAAYTLILWAEIYTTAVASAFGLARRVADSRRLQRWAPPGTGLYRTGAVAGVCLALVGAPLGFSRLVATLYPAFGAVSVGLLLLLGLRVWLPERR